MKRYKYKGLSVKDDGLNTSVYLGYLPKLHWNDTKRIFKTPNTKENGRGDKCSDILEAEKKPDLTAAMRKAKNEIFAQKHPQKAASRTPGMGMKRG